MLRGAVYRPFYRELGLQNIHKINILTEIIRFLTNRIIDFLYIYAYISTPLIVYIAHNMFIIVDILCKYNTFTNTKKYVKILTEIKLQHKIKLTNEEFFKNR